jgi:hypothetical protein
VIRPRDNTEAYGRLDDNAFKNAADESLATFSVDVDTASYADVRMFLFQNQLPPKDSVRIEELINYFNYDYAQPNGPHPIAIHTEVASAPWQPNHRLVRIGIKGKDVVKVISGTVTTVAKDVVIQVDFNPAQVSAYRLIGYENRALQNQDLNDGRKEAGEMGAGQTVTALFEIVPVGVKMDLAKVEESKYKRPVAALSGMADVRGDAGRELLTVRARYKLSDAADSTRFDVPTVDRGGAFDSATTDFRFAAAVAEFGMVLRDSPYRGNATLDQAISIADRSKGSDRNGYREEFVRLAQRARDLYRR